MPGSTRLLSQLLCAISRSSGNSRSATGGSTSLSLVIFVLVMVIFFYSIHSLSLQQHMHNNPVKYRNMSRMIRFSNPLHHICITKEPKLQVYVFLQGKKKKAKLRSLGTRLPTAKLRIVYCSLLYPTHNKILIRPHLPTPTHAQTTKHLPSTVHHCQ